VCSLRVVNHLPFGVVPDNRRAAQSFEDAHLNFLRTECDKPAEPGGKALQRFAGQPHNQIRMDMDAGFTAQKMEIVGELFMVLPPADQMADCLVERLDADLELQRAGRKFSNDFA